MALFDQRKYGTLFVVVVVVVVVVAMAVSCGTSNGSPTPAISAQPGAEPVDSGTGFVFSVVEKYSLDPVRIVEVDYVRAGQPSGEREVGYGTTPTRHRSGLVTQTERCADPQSSFGLELYSHIALVDQSGESEPITPCSAELTSEPDASKLDGGRLSPDGHRVVAHIFTVGRPASLVVFEDGQLIERFEGFHASAWIDDDTLAIIGSGLATLTLGGEPMLLTDELSGDLHSLAASADGQRIAVVNDGAVWVIGSDGSALRQVLDPGGYTFPAWSPDGRFVAALQREPVQPLDGVLVGSPELVGGTLWNYTHLQTVTMVDVESGRQFVGDVSMHMTDAQMPHGYLSWF